MATPTREATRARLPSLAAAAVPVALGAAILTLVFAVGPETILPSRIDPAEELFLETVRVVPEGFVVDVVNSGGVPLSVEQVLVDEAYWQFTIEPDAQLEPLERARIHIPYPWVEGEAHEIVVLTHTGTDFGAEVPVAVAAPAIDGAFWARFAGVGLLVGVLPVGLGMALMPYIRRAHPRAERFVLALTIGLLLFLAIDALGEGLELAEAVAPVYNPQGLLALTAAAAFLLVWGLDRWTQRLGLDSRGLRLAWMVALGIGLHNLGEGLAIGAAWAAGAVALGTFLILGFTLHNVTEGPAILAPARNQRVRAATWLGLLALAGLPTIFGGWLGGLSPAPTLVLAFLGLGLGAIVVVAAQVASYQRAEDPAAMRAPETLVGLFLGFALMWATGLLVTL